jgi:hypothetical protein
MADRLLGFEKIYIKKTLEKRGLNYLKVAERANSIAIYSEDSDGKLNRCRFIKIAPKLYVLSIANNSGKWESTPFEGILEELLEMVIEQFPWTLESYDQE